MEDLEKEVLNIKVDKGYGHVKKYKVYRNKIPNKLYKVLDCLIIDYISSLDIELSDDTASFKITHKLGYTKILSRNKAVTFDGCSNLILVEYRKREDKHLTYDINNSRLLNPILSKYFSNNSEQLREDVEALDNIDTIPSYILFEAEIVDKFTKIYEKYGAIGKVDIPSTLLKVVNDFSCKDYNIDTLVKVGLERRDEIRYMKFKYEEYSISFSYVEDKDFVSMFECKNIGKNVGYENIYFYDSINDNVVSISTTVMKEFMKFFVGDRTVFDDLIKSIVTLEN